MTCSSTCIQTEPRALVRRAFTLIELLVVIGVLMILLGFVLPALRLSRDRAVQLREMSDVRQHAIAVLAYCAQSGDVFPISSGNAWTAAATWELPVRATGIMDDSFPLPTPSLSLAMVYPASRMRPGHTEPPIVMRSRAIRTGAVRYPSDKGLLVRNVIDIDGEPQPWCCIDRPHPRVPGAVIPPGYKPPERAVAMTDGGVHRGTWHDFINPELPLTDENSIGSPVLSTWYGSEGMDRPHAAVQISTRQGDTRDSSQIR